MQKNLLALILVSLLASCGASKKEKEIVFNFPEMPKIIAKGINVEEDGKDELEWEYDFPLNENIQLCIGTATDSAGNFTLYSGYLYYPSTNKWKLIGTCKITGRWGALKSISTFKLQVRYGIRNDKKLVSIIDFYFS